MRGRVAGENGIQWLEEGGESLVGWVEEEDWRRQGKPPNMMDGCGMARCRVERSIPLWGQRNEGYLFWL